MVHRPAEAATTDVACVAQTSTASGDSRTKSCILRSGSQRKMKKVLKYCIGYLCGMIFFESQSIYTDIYCVYNFIYIYFVVLDIHDYMIVYVCLIICVHSCFLSMILPILKPSKIPRVSKSCQLHWAFGQGTQAEEIGCSAMSVGGICCIVLSINQDMFSHS